MAQSAIPSSSEADYAVPAEFSSKSVSGSPGNPRLSSVSQQLKPAIPKQCASNDIRSSIRRPHGGVPCRIA